MTPNPLTHVCDGTRPKPGLLAAALLALASTLLPATAEAQSCVFPEYPAGCCDGAVSKTCIGDSVFATNCAASGQACVWNQGSGAYGCGDATSPTHDPSGQVPRGCAACTPNCDGKTCGDDGCGGTCGECTGNGWCDGFSCQCTPNCEFKRCGDDGCGGSCGSCGPGQKCESNECVSCTPDCAGKRCGPDGCGFTCGSCFIGETCNESTGQCDWCTPNCTGKSCGSDGCGGTCGNCPNSGTCNASGQCLACTPNCTGKTCGDDGCGGVCGTCTGGKICNGSGQCAACVPNCEGRSCGDDGCGGSCGTCAAGQQCEASQCVTPNAACSAMTPGGCCDGNTLRLCTGSQLVTRDCAAEGLVCGSSFLSPTTPDCRDPFAFSGQPVECPAACTPDCSGKQCGSDGCGGTCGLCLEFGANRACENNRCICRPNCSGKNCGSDGCGGSCGTCASGEICTSWGGCECRRQCDGKSCGSDGCGGLCGTCAAGETCSASGQCQACIPQCDGKSCGDNGCGGTCGTCGTGDVCNQGVCVSQRCPSIPTAGCCSGELARTCSAGGLAQTDCEKQGKLCGWDDTTSSYTCIAASSSVSDSHPRTCPWEPACVPDCTGKECGSDGCGGTCGGCAAGIDCDRGKCGTQKVITCDDLPEGGCCKDTTTWVACEKTWNGGKKRPNVLTCSDWHKSVTSLPNPKYYCSYRAKWKTDYSTGVTTADGGETLCNYKETAPTEIDSRTACPAFDCLKRCTESDQCGDDGCGGTCGTCGPGSACQPWPYADSPYGGRCVKTCVPSCTGKTCGSDGCGGTCGTCASGEVCSITGSGAQCKSQSACGGAQPGIGCCDGNVLKTCDGNGTLTETTCGVARTSTGHEYKTFCGWSQYEGKYTCNAESLRGGADPAGTNPRACVGGTNTCTPSCNGRSCGPDGCGGTCGTCATDYTCDTTAGQCLAPCTSTTPAAPIIPRTNCCVEAPGYSGGVAKAWCEGTRSGLVGCENGCGVVGNEGYARCLSWYEKNSGAATPKLCNRNACTPSCTGKTCGSDGCTGSCGTCGAGQQCGAGGNCEAIPCGSVGAAGRCTNGGVEYCVDGALQTETCAASGDLCGWNAGIGGYSCGTDGREDPSGTHDIGVSSCRCAQGQVCGTNACGAECGTCTPGLTCSSKNTCERGNQANTCEGRCGLRVDTWACQCDAECVERGDCCATYDYYCSERTSKPTECGDRLCAPKSGENCASCPADCNACQSTSGFDPPWNAPYPQVVAAEGTGAQRTEHLIDPLEDVLPSAPPYPLDGLLAYVPRSGQSLGAPGTLVFEDSLKTGGTVGSVAGALGTAMSFSNESGATAQPTFGTVRIVPDAVLPAQETFAGGKAGGFTLAFWARVPASAPDVVNPLVQLEGKPYTGADWLAEDVCGSPRARDSKFTLNCPVIQEYGVARKVDHIQVYFGSTTGSPRAGSCSFAENGADNRCSWSGAQAWAEKACLGKASCTLNLSDLPAGTCGAGENARLMVRAVCGVGSTHFLPSLVVGNKNEGRRLSMRLVGETLVTGETTFNDGEWRHVALTYHPYEGASALGTTTLYVDGRAEATSDRITFRPFDEIRLGTALKSILGSGATASNVVSDRLASIAQFDEVFVYDRALGEDEVVSLRQKRNGKLLRVWPTVDAERAVKSGRGFTGTASAVKVEAPHLLDRATTGRGNVKFHRAERALGLPAGTMLSSTAVDAELGGLAQFTLAGWVRPSALTADTALLELLENGASRLKLKTSAACDGRGVTGELAGTPAVSSTKCAHGLAAGEWAFVAFVQTRTHQRVYVDGHEIGSAALTSSTPLFDGTSAVARTFKAGNGVDLFWSGLFGRAVPPEELVLWRGQGPVTWFDGHRYAKDGKVLLRDFAAYRNNGPTTAGPDLALLSPSGAAVTGAGATGPLTLKKTGVASDPGEVRVKATGRFWSLADTAGSNAPQSGIRPFSIATRVRLPNLAQSTTPIVRLDFPAQATVPALFDAKLVCTISAARLASCSLQGFADMVSGRRSFASERVSLTVPSHNMVDMDVALSFNGSGIWASIGSGRLFAGKSVAVETWPAGTRQYATGNEPPVFRIGPQGGTADSVLIGTTRLYARALSPVELQRFTRTDCASLECGATDQVCVAGVDGGMPTCGGCLAGSRFVSAGASSACTDRRPFLAQCQLDSQCASGICSDRGRCAQPWDYGTGTGANAGCKERCFADGRTCVQQSTNGTTAVGTCSAECRRGYEGGSDLDVACTWVPTIPEGDVCEVDAECMSGACVPVTEYAYNVGFTTRTNCDGLTDKACPRWVNTYNNGNKPFACEANKYGFYSCPPYVGSITQNPIGKRCGYTSQLQCQSEHMIPRLTRDAGEFDDDVYACDTCSRETFQGKPLWVKSYKWLTPQACDLMAEVWTRRGIERRGTWVDMYNEPSIQLLKKLVLDKEGVVTPADWAEMEKKGIGAPLLGYERTSNEFKTSLWEKYGHFGLASCFTPSYTDSNSGRTIKSAFYDPNFNRQTCVANKFPNGTVCPPPNAGVGEDEGDQFCDSGFCARDTKICETGYGRLEALEAGDRNDKEGGSGGSDLGPIKLVQTNRTVMEVRKNETGPGTDAFKRIYSMSATNAHGATVFGSPVINALEFTVAVTANPSDTEGHYASTVALFGIEIPGSASPATSCEGASFENGEYKPPAKPCTASLTDMKPAIPVVSICLPSPGGCKDSEQGLDLLRPSKVEKGPLCLRKTSLVGPIPITVEASLGIDACLGVGTDIDSETFEPKFEVRPSIGVGLDVRGGVGGSIGPVEAFAGVRAVITVVELAFPIKWALKVAAITKDKDNQGIENMWQATFYRNVGLELTILKLAMSLFAEVGVSIAKVEWDQIMFEYGGIKLTWDLDTADLAKAKVDFEHRTADQADQ